MEQFGTSVMGEVSSETEGVGERFEYSVAPLATHPSALRPVHILSYHIQIIIDIIINGFYVP